MTPVNFLVTYGAILKPRGSQIVEGRRYATKHLARDCTRVCTNISVALQADESNFMPREHPWICRSMRLVATATAFQTHRRMLECEGSSLVGVTAQTPGLVCGKGSHLLGSKFSMWIVAVDTRHCALRQSVRVRPLKLRPCTQMTARALRINLGRFTQANDCHWPVNGMAPAAGNLSFCVPALNATGMGGLI